MPDPEPIRSESRSPRRGWWILALLAATMIGAVAVAIWILSAGVLQSQGLMGLLHRDTHTDISTIIDRVQRLQRLETIVYTTDQVVEGDRESPVLPNFLAGDRLLLIARGEVIAGVDLGRITKDDIHVLSANTVQIHLPDAQIFVARLDNGHTRVYSRSTGLMVAADPTLETEVRGKAEQQIRDAALADGILQKARDNSRATVRSLLLDVGFANVEVD